MNYDKKRFFFLFESSVIIFIYLFSSFSLETYGDNLHSQYYFQIKIFLLLLTCNVVR